MSRIYLKSYQWVLRAVVELLDLFPPRRIDKEEFILRKGHLPDDFIPHPEGSIWVHGASLGEAITMRPFLTELARQYGRERIVCTSTTIDGLRQLRKDAICGFATLLPIELPAYSKPFIDKIKPKLMLISETEIWPLLLSTLKRKKIPYGIINGRVNEKSVRLMRIFWPLFSEAVENCAFVFPQEKQYARRFKILGIAPQKLTTLGCFKYDFIDSKPDIAALRQKLGLPDSREIICFGSTHAGEEEQILDALEPLWGRLNATVILAPRRVKRVAEVEKLLKSRNLDYSKLSQQQRAGRVVIVDSLGELRTIYAASALAYVGGSLVKHGGHNLMEPTSFSVPLLTGPHTFNFRYEMMALKKAQAVCLVNSSAELNTALEDWLNNPQKFTAMGAKAKAVLDQMSGASYRTIEMLQKLNYLPRP